MLAFTLCFHLPACYKYLSAASEILLDLLKFGIGLLFLVSAIMGCNRLSMFCGLVRKKSDDLPVQLFPI
jgi:hypothetical protein